MAAPCTVRLDAGGVSLAGHWALCWDEITGLRYYRLRAGDSNMLGFDLVHPGGARSISLNTAEGPGIGGRAEYESALEAIAAELEARGSELRVEFARGGWQRWAFFGLGVVALAVGLGLFGVAVADGVSRDRLVAAATPLGLLALMGAGLSWINLPGRPAPSLSLRQFRAFILRGPESRERA